LPDGTKVKAGGMVTYVPYSMGRMEYNWGPDAASFVPERWFKEGVLKNESPFKFTAFQVLCICIRFYKEDFTGETQHSESNHIRYWLENGVNVLCGWAQVSLVLCLPSEIPL